MEIIPIETHRRNPDLWGQGGVPRPQETLKFNAHHLTSPIGRAAAAAARSLQSCPTLCDPIDGSPLAPLSLGFARQEYWSGFPFPSPMHESEKQKSSRSVVPTLSDPMDCRLLRPWDFPGKSTGVESHCLLQKTGIAPCKEFEPLEMMFAR